MRIRESHGCGAMHTSPQSLASCEWRDDKPMITGDGPVAVIERCDLFAVALFPTREAAEQRLRRLDAVGCGRRCEGKHDLVVLLADAV